MARQAAALKKNSSSRTENLEEMPAEAETQEEEQERNRRRNRKALPKVSNMMKKL